MQTDLFLPGQKALRQFLFTIAVLVMGCGFMPGTTPSFGSAGKVNSAVMSYTPTLLFGPADSGIAKQDLKIAATDNNDQEEEEEDEPDFFKKQITARGYYNTFSSKPASSLHLINSGYAFRKHFSYSAYKYILFRAIRI